MIKNILLVDKSVPDHEVFLQSVNAATKAVPYSEFTTYEQLRQSIPGPVDQLGIVFVKGSIFLGKPFTEQHEFFQSLVTQFELKHLDFLGCETLNDPEWKTFYAKFTNVIIGASDNRTGNIQYGGDWTMESTMEDVEGIYFTKSIEYYRYLLDPDAYTFFFTKNTGELYGMGNNSNYNLGQNYKKYLTEPTEILMNSTSIGGIEKIRCSSGGSFVLFLKDNKLYGFGSNTWNILQTTSNFNVISNPIEIVLPITGTILDFEGCSHGSGFMSLYVVVNGRLFSRNSIIATNFVEIKTFDENETYARMISSDGDSQAAVFNNDVYRFTYTNHPTNSEGVTLVKMSFPVEASGTITNLKCASGGNRLSVIRGGILYVSSNNTFTKYNAVYNTTVTHLAMNAHPDMYFVNGGILYTDGSTEYNPFLAGFENLILGGVKNANKTVPTPGPVDYISTKGDSYTLLLLSNGIVYGAGDNSTFKLSSSESYKYGFKPILLDGSLNYTATMVEAGGTLTAIVTANKLYVLGDNTSGKIGVPLLPTSVSVPIQIQLNGDTFMNVPNNLISATNYYTWIAVGDKLYCSGTDWEKTSGLINSVFSYKFSPKFIEIPTAPAVDGPITFVGTAYRCNAIVKGGRIYGLISTGNFREMLFPTGVTGTVKSLITPEWAILVFIQPSDATKSCLYISRLDGPFNMDWTLRALTYQGQPITNVTKCGASRNGILCYRNGGFLFQQGAPGNPNPDFFTVPMPAGATGEVEIIESGLEHICVVIGGVLYGMGNNDQNSLGTGPMSETALSNIYLNNNTTPITGVTAVKCTYKTTYITINNTVYGFGNADEGRLGLNAVSTSLNLISTGIMGDRMTISSSSTYNDRNYGPNGITYKIVGDLLSKIDYVQFGPTRVYKNTFLSVGATATFAVPAGTGTVIPVLTDTDGSNYTLSAFNYSNPMVIQSLSTSTGNANQILRIKGVDLSSLTSVKFGTATTSSVTSLGNNEYSVIVPAQGAQSTNVTVRVLDPYGTESNAISFTYSTFVINAVTNLSDQAITQAAAGDRIKLLGSNFLSEFSVWFGNAQVPSNKVIRTLTSLIVTVPNVVGDVKIRCYDETSNFAEYGPLFTCKVAATTLATSPAVITYSTSIDGVLYYARTDKTIVRVVENAFQVVYTHNNDIYGLTNAPDLVSGNPTLYFGDRTTRKLYSLDTMTPIPFTRVDFYSDVTMNPMAMKISNGNLFVACANANDSVSPALIKIAMSTKAQVWTRSYAGLEAYQLRGLTLSPIDTNIYLSAVPFVGGVEGNLAEGRVIKLDSTGATQNISFITGIANPKDLTFLAGYLVVDGNLEFFTPTGTPVSSFSTNAGTISVQGNTAYFTSDTGATSALNRLTVEEYVDNTVLSIGNATPLSGPEGTLVFISGTMLSVSNIVKVEINGTQLPLSEYWISNILLTVRIPTGSGQVPIRVTYGENLTKDFLFSYVNPDIVNLIPLYSQDLKKYHFTGHYLRNIAYVAFVDTQTTTVTLSNRKAVYNVTDTSFDCAFDTIPVNSTRILLLDAYGNTTYEDSATFMLSSETCFLGGTPVLTDQGLVAIDKIDPEIHTLGKKEIVAITKIRYNGDSLVLLEQDSLRKKYPTRDTVISRKHKIYYKGKMKTAESLVGHKGVQLVPYHGEFLYNVLLNTHEKMSVNGMICETLHPKNPIVKFFI